MRLTHIGRYAMNVIFDHERLLKLLSSLYTLTGIRANILNTEGRDICLSSDHAPFCEGVSAAAGGYARCVACDMQAVKACAASGKDLYSYRCHAGICETILPIRTGTGVPPLAYLIFGQFLDDSPMEQQWKATLRALDWMSPQDVETLRPLFFSLRQYSSVELDAYADILEALTAHIRRKEMILTVELTDLQKLDLYLNQHYTEKLSLASISAQLNIGRTRLCMLARELSGGKTLSSLITQKRIDAAKTLLQQSSQPVSEIAEAVGIGDYNYFSKVFRSVTGTTPSAYRKAFRGEEPSIPTL